MTRRSRQRRIAFVLSLALPLLFSACSSERDNPPLGPRPTIVPNAGPVTAPDGETPEHAAKRLFGEAYRQAMAGLPDKDEAALLHEEPQRPRLRGAEPGSPVPFSRDYLPPTGDVAWVLRNDAKAVTGNLFAAMWPIAMKKDEFWVPMVKDGREICGFGVRLVDGHWVGTGPFIEELPLSPSTRQVATDKLERALGKGTKVRFVMFVPSGYEFAVGRNHGREAAVFISYAWTGGPGIMNADLDYPYPGPKFPQLFNQPQLQKLITSLYGK